MHDVQPTRRTRIDPMLVLLFFYYVHPFVLAGFSWLSYTITFFIPLIYLVTHISKFVDTLSVLRQKRFAFAHVCTFFFILWAFITIALNGFCDLSYLDLFLAVARGLLRYLFLGLVLVQKKGWQEGVELFCLYFALANVAYVLFSTALIAMPSFRAHWFQLIAQDSLWMTEQPMYYNRVGINGFAGYRETFLCSIGVALGLYAAEKLHDRFTILLLFGIVAINFLGNIFYGRTGTFASIGCITVFIISKARYILYNKNIVKLFLVAIVMFCVVVVTNEYIQTSIRWLVEPFLYYLEHGYASTGSTLDEITGSMLFMPEAKTFIMGDGIYTVADGSYYFGTDLGFMRLMLFGGVIACAFCYLMMASYIRLASMPQLSTGISLLLCFVLFEYKGDIWYTFLPILVTMSLLQKDAPRLWHTTQEG